MSVNRAVVVDPSAPEWLVLRDVEAPSPRYDEAVVRVEAVSLNRGEVHRAQGAQAGHRPGWDLAGVVEQAASDGSGPREGQRVVGMLPLGAWARRVAVPTVALAPLPEGVSFAQAATLPVAGMTALYALSKGGLLLERPVLVTGATGGVGSFALQLGRLSGARLVAHVRKPDQEAEVRANGAEAVLVGEELPADTPLGRHHLVVESVGGGTLGKALTLLAEDGVCVSLGASASPEVTFNTAQFFLTGRASLYGFILFAELRRFEPASIGLARLASLVDRGLIKPAISVEAPWTEVADLTRQLIDRRYAGKAVLHLSD